MYSRVWRFGVVTGVTVGLLRLLFVHPVTTALLLPMAAVYLLLLVRVWHWTLTSGSNEPSTPPPPPRAVFVATVIGFGVIGLVHLEVLLGLAFLVVGVLTSPWLTGRWHSADFPALEETATAHGQSDVRPVPGVALADLDDADLCRRWRESYAELAVADPNQRWRVVELRAAYLDEMTRRHPRAMSAWLADGCYAWASPEAYFKDSA